MKASKWAGLARQRREIAREIPKRRRAYAGRMLVDGEIYTRLRRQRGHPKGPFELQPCNDRDLQG